MLFLEKLMNLLLLTTFISTLLATYYYDEKSQHSDGEYEIKNSITFFKSVFQYDITKRPSAEECLKLELFRTTFI